MHCLPESIHLSASAQCTDCQSRINTHVLQQQMIELLQLCRLLESPEKDSHSTAQQVADSVDSSQSAQLSTEQKGSLKQSVYTMLADTSPSTPPAGKPSLSPPPPDTPCDSAPGSVSSDKADHHNSSSTSPHTSYSSSVKPSATSTSLHASARAFVPNVNAPAFVPGAAPKISNINAHTANGNGYHGYTNGYGVNGFSPSAQSGSSPHAAWDDAAYSEAAGYQSGWAGGYDAYGYADGYSGYGYGGMTPDGLFIPQQVTTLCSAQQTCSCHDGILWLAVMQWMRLSDCLSD